MPDASEIETDAIKFFYFYKIYLTTRNIFSVKQGHYYYFFQ